MKRELLLSAACVVVGAVVVSACSAAKPASGAAAPSPVGHATAAGSSTTSPAPSPVSSASTGGPAGFPSYAQLTHLTNYVSTTTVSTLVTTQHVHSPSNYLQTLGTGKGLVQVLYQGEMYGAIAGLSKDVTKIKADATSGEPELYGYAKQVEDFATKSAAAVVKKVGTCQVAGANGTRWQLGVGGPSTQYVQMEFVACTRVGDGALLSVQEGAKLLTAGATVSAAIVVTSIGGVRAYTPADVTASG